MRRRTSEHGLRLERAGSDLLVLFTDDRQNVAGRPYAGANVRAGHRGLRMCELRNDCDSSEQR